MNDLPVHAARVQQFLMTMLPRRWKAARMQLERVPTGLRLVKLDAEIDEGELHAGAPPPNLGFDQTQSIAGLNEAFTAIGAALPQWGGSAEMKRNFDRTFTLFLEGFELNVNVDDLLLSDDLFEALDSAEPYGEIQERFDANIRGFQSWGYDTDTARLRFVLADGRTWELPGQIIGSWSSHEGTFMWGWANSSVPEIARSAVAQVREYGAAVRIAALTTETFSCSQQLAVRVALLAAQQMNALGVYGGAHAGGAVFIAAMLG